MSDARYAVGVDLGTTHTAMAAVSLQDEGTDGPAVMDIPQLVSRGSLETRALLPSFIYFGHETEGPLALPWDEKRRFAVGEFARSRAAEAPTRVVASAKSWLSHTAVDRRSAILPMGAPEDVDKTSPVEASWRYLDHVAEAWDAGDAAPESGERLAEQDVILTVPASFDAAARDLTIEAAYTAGLEKVTLLEEPQAALYAWIEATGEDWRKHLHVGDIVLVVDVGGGTTDFSAIAILEKEGELELHRVAVGDHILLGGDNMDLTLAHQLRQKLEARGHQLDRWQMNSLTYACRAAKEKLLGDPDAQSVPVAITGRGSQLLGSSLRTELTRDEVQQTLVEGFFPSVDAATHPVKRPRAGLTQVGLPYAADPAVTKHLAAFLTRQAGATAQLEGFEPRSTGMLLHPTAVLFNGGVFKADVLRKRLLDTLNGWLTQDGGSSARVLPGEDLDLAVARGASYFGLVRQGRGLRIRGGIAQAYYVGIESPMPAVPGMEPPVTAVCVAPFGLDEGSPPAPLPQELGLVVGEPVSFRFFTSSTRREDSVGTALEDWDPSELQELSPIEVTLPAEERPEGDVVPVRLSAAITPVGTLLLEALPIEKRQTNERWKIELSVRSQ